MGLLADLQEFNKIFFENKVRFALIGGMSLAHWGVQRATADIEMIPKDCAKIKLIFFAEKDLEEPWNEK